jgi:hypothetical protein
MGVEFTFISGLGVSVVALAFPYIFNLDPSSWRIVFYCGLSLVIASVVLGLKDKFVKSDRFSWVMSCRKKFGHLMNNSHVIDQLSYTKAYDKFTQIRLECVEAMKSAKFQPDNFGKMEFLINIEPFNNSGQQIVNMCRRAVQIIEDAIKDEKANNT